MRAPEFKVIEYDDGGTEGKFIWGEERESLFQKHYDALEALEIGVTTKAKAELEHILKVDPYFIDAYNSMASIYQEEGDLLTTIELYNKAVDIGKRMIPVTFSGQIIWGDLDNRPFLRALHGKGICSIMFARYEQAIDIFEQLLAYNPNDNQGVRYLLGDVYLKVERLESAEEVLSQNADYPPNRYSHAYVLIKKGKYVEAITTLRKAFMENIYIVELILGRHPVLKYDIWHGSNYAKPDVAFEYFRDNVSLWDKGSLTLKFIRDVFENSTVQSQIIEMYKLIEELGYIRADSTENINQRREVMSDMDDLIASIDDDSSRGVRNEMLLMRNGT